MLREKLLIKIICLALSVVLALSLLGGCNKKDPENVSSVQSEQNTPANTADNTEPDGEESEEPDNWEEEPDEEIFEEPYYEEEEFDEDPIYNLEVFNGQEPVQTNYRGISSTVYHAFGYMKDDKSGRVYTDDMLELELDRLQDTGIHFCRTRFDTKWIWSATKNNWDFNSARANYFYDYCKALQDRGMEIALQVGWHFTSLLSNANTSISEADYLLGNGEDLNGENSFYNASNISEEDLRYVKAGTRYGDVYAKLLKELKSRGINNVSHLFYFTESCSYWDDTPQTVREEHYGKYLLTSQTIKSTLTKLGVGDWAKHTGPLQASDYPYLMRYILERDTELFDVLGTHYYPNGKSIIDNTYYDIYAPLFDGYIQPLKENNLYGKTEFWMDEYQVRDSTFKTGVVPTTPWVGVQGVVGAIAAAQYGVSNISTWQSFDQLWTDQTNTGGEFLNGIHICGHAPSLFMSTIPRGCYYMYGLYGKYNGHEGGTVYKTNIEDDYWLSGLYINAVKLADGNFTITVVNADVDDKTFTVNFEKALGKTLYRHAEVSGELVPDSYAELATVDKVYVDVKDKFIDTLPSGTVAVYTTVKG